MKTKWAPKRKRYTVAGENPRWAGPDGTFNCPDCGAVCRVPMFGDRFVDCPCGASMGIAVEGPVRLTKKTPAPNS